jgi:hypothetical protein
MIVTADSRVPAQVLEALLDEADFYAAREVSL